jgi:hypothetical protein
MMQHSVAKPNVHLINTKHVQVPLYQSHGVARGEFSSPLCTSGSFSVRQGITGWDGGITDRLIFRTVFTSVTFTLVYHSMITQ